ncbi:MAG: hypothetical protein AB1626_02810 [Candidatus Micrarchaeota archaeon]
MKAQASLELMVAMAAYFALLASFFAFENSVGSRVLDLALEAKARNGAENACLQLDFLALDGKRTAIALEAGSYSAAGSNDLFAEFTAANGSTRQTKATCATEVSGTKKLFVSHGEREPA